MHIKINCVYFFSKYKSLNKKYKGNIEISRKVSPILLKMKLLKNIIRIEYPIIPNLNRNISELFNFFDFRSSSE